MCSLEEKLERENYLLSIEGMLATRDSSAAGSFLTTLSEAFPSTFTLPEPRRYQNDRNDHFLITMLNRANRCLRHLIFSLKNAEI